MSRFALVTLLWPSLGPLPFALADSVPSVRAAAHKQDAANTLSVAAPHDHQHDASDIPGSPTHPADHDCSVCLVLNQLARCVPNVVVQPAIAPAPVCPVQPPAFVEEQSARDVTVLPPVRAPPARRT